MSVYGIGVYSAGKYDCKEDGTLSKHYNLWHGMFRRCYSKPYLDRNNSYLGCSVDERFHNFQDFMLWAENQVGFNIPNRNLDKDLLIKSNKVYCPENCVFIPGCLNRLLLQSDKIRGEFPVGVSYYKSNDKYRAGCNVNGKIKHIGYFETVDKAFLAYKEFKEDIILKAANKYKEIIDDRAYRTLINYKIEFDD